MDRRKYAVLPDGGSDARVQRALQRMELMMATTGGQWRVFSRPKEEDTRWTVAGMKKKTSTVRNMVDGEDIFDLQFQRTSQRTQITRSTLAKVMDKVGARQ